MEHYYIHNGLERGYIVVQLGCDGEGHYSRSLVCNFGNRQGDAIVFRDDCNNNNVDFRRIQQLIKNYTDTPYKYYNKRLRKQ